jgi:uncharacterized protein YndB with AHSA1/START domain
MWKWIIGVLAAIVLVIGIMMYRGYQQMTSGGDSATVTIAASPARVFAALATPDSMATWVTAVRVVAPLGRGVLAVGDTLRMELSNGTAPGQRWIVREVAPPTRVVFEQLMDSVARGAAFFVRRDSLAAKGDSTIVVTSFSTPFMASISAASADSGGKRAVVGAMVSGSSKLMIGTQRILQELNLKRLKAHVEGTGRP